jgi:hypothetical protein
VFNSFFSEKKSAQKSIFAKSFVWVSEKVVGHFLAEEGGGRGLGPFFVFTLKRRENNLADNKGLSGQPEIG